MSTNLLDFLCEHEPKMRFWRRIHFLLPLSEKLYLKGDILVKYDSWESKILSLNFEFFIDLQKTISMEVRMLLQLLGMKLASQKYFGIATHHL